MLSADQGEDSPNVSSAIDPDKARLPFVLRLPLVLHWLQQYLENHPADRDVVLKAVTGPKLLLTPASTPSNTDIPSEPAPTPIPSQFIEQEVENNSGGDADQHASPFMKPQDQSSGIGHGAPPYQAYVEDADDSSGDSQHSANLDDLLPTSDGDDRQDGWSSGDSQHSANLDDLLSTSDGDDLQDGKLSRQGATSSISQQLHKSSKRKQNFRDRKNPKRLQIKALDGTEVYIGSRSPQLSETFELQSAPDQKDETHGQRPDNSDAGQDSGFVASLATSPTTPTIPEKACSSRQAPTEDNLSAERDVAFAVLPAHLREKAQMIGDIVTRGVAWHFFNYIESWFSGPTNCSNAEPNPDDDVPSTSSSDRRLKELKVGIIIQENTEKSIKSMKIVARVFKRVYLAELGGKYMEETKARNAEPKTTPSKSLKNIYTDLLFPETITCNGEQLNKENGPREKAKGKLKYWLSLGEPLAMMAQRYGIGIILLLPKKLTDKDLHLFPQHLIKPFLDYIDLLHPGLREHISNLSALLPGIVEAGLPPQRIVLETYSSDQLSELGNRPLKELFQACTGIDSQRVYAVAGLPLGQDPSNVTYSEYPHPLIHPFTIDQQVDMAVKEPFYSQNGDLSDKLDHYKGGPLYVNASMNSYQLNTTGDMPTSVNNSKFSVQTVDMPQEMGWSGNDQDTRTVNPRDLQLRAA